MLPAQAQPWNVLFIAVDDLNDWIGCMDGHPQAKTPNLDRFAEQGLVFDRAYCPAPICNPSRTALMTGLSPAWSGVYNNRIDFRKLPWAKDVITLPQHFSNNGYVAYGGGKIFHGPEPNRHDPASWDEYYSTEVGTPSPQGDFPRVEWPEDAHKPDFWAWGPIQSTMEECQDWRMVQGAIEILNRNHEKPFFLASGIFRPHLPFYAPQEFFDMHPLEDIILPGVYQDDMEDLTEFGQNAASRAVHRAIVEQGHWRRAVQAYLASSSFADACIGALLDALDKSPHRDNTIVIIWGDHGWHLGEKEHWAKFTMWEEANHCPLLIRVPGMTTPGSRCPAPVNLQDLYPTLVELCGLPMREGHPLHGNSIVPLIKDPHMDWPYPVVNTHGLNHAVRTMRWSYIRYKNGDEELYDFEKDPDEWFNLAADPAYRPVMDSLAEDLPGFTRPVPGDEYNLQHIAP